jgi:hypothetical protein
LGGRTRPARSIRLCRFASSPKEILPERPTLLRLDPRPAAVTFVNTEHFTLQGARAATIAESISRATMFVGSVSAGLVALVKAAAGTKTPRPTSKHLLLALMVCEPPS